MHDIKGKVYVGLSDPYCLSLSAFTPTIVAESSFESILYHNSGRAPGLEPGPLDVVKQKPLQGRLS